mmetsp:Transcript_7260/g.10701  ORF Transcript_7260/g.10701 Transcript_7260/m.10701 type:complete len:200 (+) Transcript_7260:171-770(+)
MMIQHRKKCLSIQHSTRGTIRRSLPSDRQLGNRTTAEPFGLLRHLINFCLTNPILQGNLLRSRRMQQIPIHVHCNHSSTFFQCWQTEFHHLIDAICDGFIELRRLVAGVYHHKFIRLRSRAIQKCVEGIALIFRDVSVRFVFLISTLQKRVRLVHEQQQTASTGMRPIEQFVQFRHSIATERGNITTRQNRVFQIRVLG